jgi:hypothetical protein
MAERAGFRRTDIGRRCRDPRLVPSFCALLGAALGVGISPAQAMPLETGSDVTVRWDNTITLSTASQLHGDKHDGAGYFFGFGAGSAAIYDRGTYTPFRADLLSELQIDHGDFGLRTSAAGRFEQIETPGAYRADLTCGQSGTEQSCSRGQIELFDAFVHGAVTPAPEQRLSFRLGRHTVLWGESLYFPNNGIAGGQAPVDTTMIERLTGYAGPTSFRPVGQLSMSWQPVSGFAVDLYDQFEWRPSRLGVPSGIVAAGSIPDDARLGAAPSSFARSGGKTPASTDQFGVGLKWHEEAADYGLYALRFDAKTPVLHFAPGTGTFNEEFPEGIEIYGASMSRLLGPASIGAEISGRRNMPLVTAGVIDQPTQRGSPSRGSSLHAQLSWTYPTPPLPGIPAGANWSGEIAANARLARDVSPSALDLDRTRYAGALRTVFEPQFFQVLPRLDVTLPVGLGVNFLGLSSVDPSMNRGTGDVSVGVTGTFDQNWRAALSVTHYLGHSKNVFPYDFVTPGRPLADGDFIALSLQRSF